MNCWHMVPSRRCFECGGPYNHQPNRPPLVVLWRVPFCSKKCAKEYFVWQCADSVGTSLKQSDMKCRKDPQLLRSKSDAKNARPNGHLWGNHHDPLSRNFSKKYPRRSGGRIVSKQLILHNDDVLFQAHQSFPETEEFDYIVRKIQAVRKKNIQFLYPDHKCCSHCELELHDAHCQHSRAFGCAGRDMGWPGMRKENVEMNGAGENYGRNKMLMVQRTSYRDGHPWSG